MPWRDSWRVDTWWRGSRWLLGRLGLFVACFLCGLGAFLAGAGVSERPDLPGADLATKVYYTLGLFVMGGVDFGVPDGGPVAARLLLWVAYFASPTITALAIAEGFLRAINPDWFRVRRVKDHVVVAGCGELALLFLERLREVAPNAPVFVVENDPECPRLEVVRRRYGARVLIADVRGESLLDLVNLERAAKVFLFTGDDLANLEACARILTSRPALANRLVVHVSDLHLLRVVSESGAFAGAEMFNSHHIAASHLVHTRLARHFQETPELDRLVLAGFGRFGQTVLAEVQRHLRDRLGQVIVIDLEAEQRIRIFAEHQGADANVGLEVLQGDMEDPSIWRNVREILGDQGARPIFVLGCDQDETNLRVALWLSSRFPGASILVRTFHHSTVADRVAHHCSFEVESVAELVRGSMREEWFDPRRDHRAGGEGYEIVDARTGAFTRRHFLALTRREWQRAARTRAALSAIAVEVEGLEAIERERGPVEVEPIVRAVASFLRENVRPGDGVGVATGNRLSILLPGGGEASARACVDRLERLARTERFETPEGPVQVSLRFGWAVSAGGAAGSEALLTAAEASLAREKTARNA